MSNHGGANEGWGPLIGGVIAGVILEWVAMFIFFITTYGEAGRTPTLAAFVALPLLFGLLLLFRRTRRTSAAVLIGLAIGSITGASVCAGLLFSDGGL